MMGINTSKNLIGVNNINTANAQAGLIWPALVRKVLKETNLSGMRQKLIDQHGKDMQALKEKADQDAEKNISDIERNIQA